MLMNENVNYEKVPSHKSSCVTMSLSQWLNPETTQRPRDSPQKAKNPTRLKGEIDKWLGKKMERGLSEFQF